MAAAVEADVDDEPVAVHLREVVAVELREAARPHVRDVDVADPALRRAVDARPVRLDPVPVAERVLRRRASAR